MTTTEIRKAIRKLKDNGYTVLRINPQKVNTKRKISHPNVGFFTLKLGNQLVLNCNDEFGYYTKQELIVKSENMVITVQQKMF